MCVVAVSCIRQEGATVRIIRSQEQFLFLFLSSISRLVLTRRVVCVLSTLSCALNRSGERNKNKIKNSKIFALSLYASLLLLVLLPRTVCVLPLFPRVLCCIIVRCCACRSRRRRVHSGSTSLHFTQHNTTRMRIHSTIRMTTREEEGEEEKRRREHDDTHEQAERERR